MIKWKNWQKCKWKEQMFLWVHFLCLKIFPFSANLPTGLFPFTADHPELLRAAKNTESGEFGKFFELIMKSSMLCNSDKILLLQYAKHHFGVLEHGIWIIKADFDRWMRWKTIVPLIKRRLNCFVHTSYRTQPSDSDNMFGTPKWCLHTEAKRILIWITKHWRLHD